ncbi:transposase [Oceaniovalibus sp. ACAM 378]|nr:transposase [Oceaniovalibus sp. ACAM 378]TYB84753.1 transposase [Oceaniovalibus sp. ACAM 378]
MDIYTFGAIWIALALPRWDGHRQMILSDTDLDRLIYPRTARDVSNRATQPDWAYIHRELRRKGVTWSLLWEEYRANYPQSYGYSRFCDLYTRWEGKLSPVMRQRHLLPGR